MQETLSFHILVLYRDFLAYTTKALKAQGISFGQMPFLLCVGRHPGCSQAELTRILQLDWGYSQRGITKLADTGFLSKAYDPRQGCNCLTLTPRGRQVFDTCHQVFTDWDLLRAQSLSQEETDTLVSLLTRLKEGC